MIDRIIHLCEKVDILFPTKDFDILNLLNEKKVRTVLVKDRSNNEPLFRRAFQFSLISLERPFFII